MPRIVPGSDVIERKEWGYQSPSLTGAVDVIAVDGPG